MADFVCNSYQDLIITMNKVALQSDLNTIKDYIKNIDVIKSKDIMTPCLPQFKFYLKIINIIYIKEGTNSPIISNNVKIIIQSIYIFNDINLASKPYIIKASPKSDMVVIWIDIWNAQSREKAKCLIDKCFNISSYIVTVRGVNMKPSSGGLLEEVQACYYKLTVMT